MITDEKLKEVSAYLKRHNEWRRGAEIEESAPKLLGETIDVAISAINELIALRQNHESANKTNAALPKRLSSMSEAVMYNEGDGITIELASINPKRWAVRKDGECLSQDGVFEYEPLPSNRDERFKERCRFGSLYEADMAINKLRANNKMRSKNETR